MRAILVWSVLVVSGLGGIVRAQGHPDFSGTWVLRPASEAEQAGTQPQRLVIAQSATELMVTRTSTRGEQQVAYRLDGADTVESSMLGDTHVRASWENGRLVVTRTRTVKGPSGTVADTAQEAYALEGDALIVSSTRKMPNGDSRTERYRYARP